MSPMYLCHYALLDIAVRQTDLATLDKNRQIRYRNSPSLILWEVPIVSYGERILQVITMFVNFNLRATAILDYIKFHF